MSDENVSIQPAEEHALADDATLQMPAEQQSALAALLEGKSVAAASRETGVSRMTIYRWLKSDPAFMAAHNRWQEELQTSAKGRMLALMEKAASAVEKRLDEGDGRLGMRLLEKMGAAKEHAVGPTDAKAAQAGQRSRREHHRVSASELTQSLRVLRPLSIEELIEEDMRLNGPLPEDEELDANPGPKQPESGASTAQD